LRGPPERGQEGTSRAVQQINDIRRPVSTFKNIEVEEFNSRTFLT
jgi:hypothetical protein